jgi:hypothetical protein
VGAALTWTADNGNEKGWGELPAGLRCRSAGIEPVHAAVAHLEQPADDGGSSDQVKVRWPGPNRPAAGGVDQFLILRCNREQPLLIVVADERWRRS